MSSEKRLFLCLILTIGAVYGSRMVMVQTGLIVPPPPVVAKADPAKAREKAREKVKPGEPARPDAVVARGELPDDVFARDPDAPALAPAVGAIKPEAGPRLAPRSELVLGAAKGAGPESPYRLRLQLDQRGAAVATASSMAFGAELDPASKETKRDRLDLITQDPRSDAPGSLAIILMETGKAIRPPALGELDEADVEQAMRRPEAPVDSRIWEVVRASDGAPAVRALSRVDPATQVKVQGQEIAFRIAPKEMPGLVATKVFRIWEGQDGFELDLKFAATSGETRFAYRLYGPHGIPLEGEWYRSIFQDAVFGQVNGPTTAVTTQPSHDVVKYQFDATQRVSALPLKYAGIEDQYFATLVEPWPTPETQADRHEADAGAIVVKKDVEAPQKSDLGVEIVSKPILVGPNLGEVVHTYRVFVGPKTVAALTPFGAEDLVTYRNTWLTIPGASWMAKNVISPLLDRIYALTEAVSRAFGGTEGNYGIAIILLTMTVRLAMFPIGRKQAMMAKKMQDLQPVLAELKEKYKDDKETLTKETMAVWKRNNVNPAAGCLPALIQLPIFTGLWQTLNNSVALRHSTFLYIRDLAAPDVLFQFPGFELPFLGKYFNLLPILVVSLMLVQTRLFAPPPTTPEAEMNQKMMKYMMVFMAVMFYKVPSGLGLYFITGSVWQICERLLLPKVVAAPVKPEEEDPFGDKGRGQGGRGSGPGGNGNGNGGGKAQGWLGKRLEKLLEEAAKDKTIRNDSRNVAPPGDGRDRDRGGDRPRPRSKPPGRRR